MASFKSQCCYDTLLDQHDFTTGERVTCQNCGNEFVWDGLHWRSPLELGQSKMRKLARIRAADQYARGQMGL